MQHTIVTNWLQSRRLSKVLVEFTACDLANFASKTIFFFGCRAELQCSMELKRTFGFSTRCRAERIFCQLWTHCHSNYCWIESQLCRPRVADSIPRISLQTEKGSTANPKVKTIGHLSYHRRHLVGYDGKPLFSFTLQIFYGMGFHNRCEVH